MVNICQIFGEVLYINDLLPVLPDNEQDLCHENIDLDLVNMHLF